MATNCVICGREVGKLRRDRCGQCAQYFYRHHRERPLDCRPSPPTKRAKICLACGIAFQGVRRARCLKCERYLRKHGVERPIDFMAPPPPIIRQDGLIGIVLTKGYLAIVDREDADLAELKWFAKKAPGTPVYAMRGHRDESRLHRVVLARMLGRELAPHPTERSDHVNGDSLDCRRSNLRLATSTQNAHNRAKISRAATSSYKGVFWDRAHRRWRATITVSGQRISLGRFEHEAEAARAYDAAAIVSHEEFARLNFPRMSA